MKPGKKGWKRLVSTILVFAMASVPVLSPLKVKAEDNGEQNTMTDAQYAEFGLVNNSPAEFTSDEHPMEGYEPTIISELYLAQMGRHDNWKGTTVVLDNATELSDKALNVDTMEKNGTVGKKINTSTNKDKIELQTQNACAIDYDGDGTDEILELKLSVKKDGYTENPKKRSHVEITSHDLIADSDEWVQKGWIAYDLADGKTDDACFVDGIEADASKGFVAMTAWDYDGDGREEAAVYIPSQIDDRPFITIISADQGNLMETARIYLSELNGADNTFNFHYKSWKIPTVSLATTEISGTEDLVVNVSHPLKSNDGYGAHGQCSSLGIFHYNGGNFEKAYLDPEMTYGKTRMRFCSASDADLNGNGVKELVIGGYKNTGWSKNSDVGKLASDKNLIQLLYWDSKDGKYKKVWDAPKEVDAHKDLKTDLEMTEPAALTAGTLGQNSSVDYVFLEGIVFKYSGAAASGTDERALYQSGSFENKHSMKLGGTHSAFISTAYAAMFSTGGGLSEQMVILSGDHQSSNNDNIYYDIVWIWEENGAVKSSVTNNDYIHCKNEDDNGTFVCMCPLDADEDKVILEYREKDCGWSDPALYSILQSPPYWSELTYNSESFGAGRVSYEITYGNGSALEGEWGAGLGWFVGVSMIGGVGAAGNNVKFGFGGEIGGMVQYVGSHQSAHSISDSYKISIPPGEDQAVILAVPVIAYHYSMWVPEYTVTEEDIEKYQEMRQEMCQNPENDKDIPEDYTVCAIDKDSGRVVSEKVYKAGETVPGHWEDYSVSASLSPSFSHISLEKYNELAEKYADRGLKKVDDELMLRKTIGDPSTYPSGKDELYDRDQIGSCYTSKNTATVELAEGEHELSYEVEDESELANGFSLGLEGSFYAKAVSEVSFIAASEGEAEAGIKFAAEGGASWISTNSKGVGYSVAISDLGKEATEDYIFSTQLTVFEAKNLPKGNGDSEGASVVGYLVTGIDEATAPPKLPVNLRVFGTTKTAAALQWEETPGERAADEYEVFMQDNLGETKSLGRTKDLHMVVQNLIPATTYKFAVKSYKGNQSSCMSRWVTAVTKGEGDPYFITHPENTIVTLDENSGDPVTLTAQAQAGEPDVETFECEWQKYEHADLTQDGKWEKVTEGTAISEADGWTRYELPEISDASGFPAYYRVIATQKKGGNIRSAVSKVATVFVNDAGDPDTDLRFQNFDMDLRMESEDIIFSDETDERTYYMTRGNTNADFKIRLTAQEGESIPDGGEVYLMHSDGNQVKRFLSGTAEITGDELAIHLDGSIETGEYEIAAVYPGNTGQTDNGTIYPAAMSNLISVHVIDLYIMEYHLNGGGFRSVVQDVITYKGAAEDVMIDNPVKEGYQFAGWYKDEGLTVPFTQMDNLDGTYTVTIDPGEYGENHTIGLYAGWAPAEYTISYMLNAENGEVNAPENPGTYTIESSGIVFADASRPGYEFRGWYEDEGLTKQITAISQGRTGDISLYPKWEEIPALPQDDTGAYMITSYEDLVWAAQVIKNNPEKYASATYVQMNNINCGEKEWSLPIGTEEHPFNGTWQGNDYYVLGLRQGGAHLGGLFGVIGESGLVKNLFVVDFDYRDEADIAGGVAAMNYGTIDGCGSGVNISSAATIFRDGENVPISTLNSDVKGNIAGGVAGINAGVIKNCHSNAKTDGQTAGGIAGTNSGELINIYNTGNAGSMYIAGGIAGTNTGGGSIRYGYNSEGVKAGAGGVSGGIAGTSENANIQYMWYSADMKGACGNMDDSALVSVEAKADTDMAQAAFADVLNSVIQNEKDALGLRSWGYSSGKNRGFPTLEYEVVAEQTLTASKFGIQVSVTGQIHPGAALSFVKLGAEHADYQAMLEAVKNHEKLKEGWQLALLGENGSYSTWNGSLTVQIKADNPEMLKDLVVLHRDNQGAYSELAMENPAEGLTFTTDSPDNLGIMRQGSEEEPKDPAEPEKPGGTGEDSTKPGGNAAVSGNSKSETAGTGDTALVMLMLLLAVLSGTMIVLIIRRRRHGYRIF